MCKCVQRIHIKDFFNRYSYLCDRNAKFTDDNGRPLCEKHYNRYMAKKAGIILSRAQRGNGKYAEFVKQLHNRS